jgi:ribosomal protein S18 acetylase RimI-like enzyme
MTTITQIIRPAKRSDAAGIAEVHDASWRESYRGVIRGADLERMIEARGPLWWEKSIAARNGILVLDFAGQIAGYVSFGPSRRQSDRYRHQIYELYLKPEFQGVGFGRKLYQSAAFTMMAPPIAIWCLAANERALSFYRHLQGKEIGRRGERIGAEIYETIGFGYN